MASQTTLFGEAPEQLAARLDAEILDLILGRSGGVMGIDMSDNGRAVLRMVRYRRGLNNAVKIREIAEQTGLGAREVKAAIRELRCNFHLPVGSSKHGADGGYYLMLTKEDRDAWVGNFVAQIRAEAAVLRAAAGEHAYRELLGDIAREATMGARP